MHFLIAFLFIIFLFASRTEAGQISPLTGDQKHRLIVLADMGNERDEEQQMIHLLMYANEIDIEGLIAVSGIFLNPSYTIPYKQKLHPELFDTLVNGYAKVVENLQKHAKGWPSPEYLKSIISAGQKEYGMDGVGEGKSSPGSTLIIDAVAKNDQRPIYIVVNAGSNTLAQAITDYERSHTKMETDAFVRKLIVFENGSQDDAGAWIAGRFPQIRWIRSNYQTYAYAGPGLKISGDLGPYAWQPYSYNYEGQKEWAAANIQNGHGAIGALYPDRILRGQFEFLEGGGTAPWLGLITRGLSDPSYPGWGGWSGRFTSAKQETVWSRHKKISERERSYPSFSVHADTIDQWHDAAEDKKYNDSFTPMFRWRKDQFDDLKARMDWCVQPFEAANHNPVAVINNFKEKNILSATASPGEILLFDGSESFDTDKNQKLSFSWQIYPEAGTYRGTCIIANSDQRKAVMTVPKDAEGKQIHLLLDVADNSSIAVMHDYRRIVVNVSSAAVTVSGIKMRGAARSFIVASASEFDSVQILANAGDSIVLKNGSWRDAQLKATVSGNSDAPIIIRAETPGKTIFKGNSRIRIQGNFLHVTGFVFDSIYTPMASGEALVEISKFKLKEKEEFNHHIRLSECEFKNLHMHMEGKTNFAVVKTMGRFHRVDHCKFDGTLSADNGRILDVEITGKSAANGSGYDVQALLDHNYFLNQKPQGGNGYEGLRFRCTDTDGGERTSNSIAEYNLFVRTDKEAEAISNKSDGNIYRNNTFINQTVGDLSIRGGRRSIVEYNLFINEKNTGRAGVLRFQHSDHIVRGNYFYNLSDPRRGAIEFACGNDLPDVKSPSNRHPMNILITENIIIGGKGYGIHFAGSYQKSPGREALPENLILENNWIDLDSSSAQTVLCVDASVPAVKSNRMIEGFQSRNNFYSSRSRFGTVRMDGWTKAAATVRPEMINGLEAPATDVNGGWIDVMKKLKRMTPDDVGPAWTHTHGAGDN